MLETAEERVKLLRAGFTGKQIEELYIISNNFKIVYAPDFTDILQGRKTCINQEVAVECA